MATRYQIVVVTSGSGERHDVCQVDNLREGTGVVKALEALFDAWVAAKYPDNWPIYVQHYEGCDIYACGQVVTFTYTDAWEEVDTVV